MKRDADFKIGEANPSISFITQFQHLNKRLPSISEFNDWQKAVFRENELKFDSSGYKRLDTLMKSNELIGIGVIYMRSYSDLSPEITSPSLKKIDWNKEYALSIWRGEWNEYYTSWNKKYSGTNYSPKDGTINLWFSIIVGLLPLAVIIISKAIQKPR